MMIKHSLPKLLLASGMILTASALPAQIFWNPSQDEYATVGGDGTWYRLSTTANSVPNWWNGTSNVFMSDNQNVVFEGAGTVATSATPRPGTVTFRNLTGNYTLGRTWLAGNTVTVESTAGNSNVTINMLDIAGTATRTITNNSGGTLTINGITRQLGGSNRTVNVAGSGTTRITGEIAFRADLGDNAQVVMNGTGRLIFDSAHAQRALRLQLGVTINDGELWANTDTTSLTWNGGRLVYTLSNTDNSSNTLRLFSTDFALPANGGGAFNKGTGSTFEIDFQNTGIEETYTLLVFESTNFTLSDFTAINSPQPGTFSFGTTQIGDDTFQTLLYTIPEPRVYAALFGLLALGFVAWRRRRR